MSVSPAPPPLPPVYAAAGPGPLAPAALDRWWRLFRDPTLDALEAEAMASSLDARTAAARLVEARATRNAATLQTLPTGALGANASRQKTTDVGGSASDLSSVGGITDQVNATFNVSWEVDLFGRLRLARRIAAADAAEARFSVEGIWASLAADVADAYFQLQGVQIQRADAAETLRIDEALLDVARRKAAAGAGPPDDVQRLAGQAALARAQLETLAAQYETGRRTLLILVGRDLRDTAGLDVRGDPPPVPPAPEALPAELLARRPDVREAEFRLRAELGSARLAHLAVFPTLTLLPGLGLSSIAQPGVSFIPPSTLVTSQQTTTTGFWNFGAGLTVPTLDIPRLLQQARAEDARARQAAIAYQRVVRTAYGEAQNALVALAADRQATATLEAGEGQALAAYRASKRRYDEGLVDLTTTLGAEQDWRAIRRALTTQRVETLRRSVATYKALGGGWPSAGEEG